MKGDRPTIRLGDTQALVERAGSSSAAVRALIVLGAAAVGYDLSGVRREIARMQGEDLDGAVLAALARLSDARRTHVGHQPPEREVVMGGASEATEGADLFADIGIEV